MDASLWVIPGIVFIIAVAVFLGVKSIPAKLLASLGGILAFVTFAQNIVQDGWAMATIALIAVAVIGLAIWRNRRKSSKKKAEEAKRNSGIAPVFHIHPSTPKPKKRKRA